MTSAQLTQLLTQHGIHVAATSTAEIGIQCPRCSPLHQNRRLTLYLNQQTGRWLCYRCEPRLAGRDLKSFLRLFQLEHYATQLTTPIITQHTFEHTTAFNTPAPANAPSTINLPTGFRRDWQATNTGKIVLSYLKTRLSTAAITASQVGYTIGGHTAGCAIFPIMLHKQLQFWQARQVVFNNSQLKYINPPGAHKSQVLYGYDWLSPRQPAVLVEGIFDALSTTNAVALFGKTISNHQIALLAKKHIVNVQVRLDGDATAAARYLANQLIDKLPNVQTVTIAQLAPEDDPATTAQITNLIQLNF